MKVLILAGLLSAAAIPMAAAVENTTECQVDDARRTAQQRAETPAAPRAVRPTAVHRAEAAQDARAASERRRSGKRIPDAELIGPRGSL